MCLASAEIFDPGTRTFAAVGNPAFARVHHTASILPDGKVLIAGGTADQHLDSLEVFDPSTNTFTSLSSTMTTPRSQHSAIVLADGRIYAGRRENSDLLLFDVNYQSDADNVSPNIVFRSDSKTGFVPYTGSGVVVHFRLKRGRAKENRHWGRPEFMTPLLDGQILAVVSVLDNRIFLIDMQDLSLKATYSFNGLFGFGSILTLSPDGTIGYISSTPTGEVIKFDIATVMNWKAGKPSGACPDNYHKNGTLC